MNVVTEAGIANFLLDGMAGIKKKTRFVDKNTVIRITVRTWKGEPNPHSTELNIHAGRPNYAERAIIKKETKAGRAFPFDTWKDLKRLSRLKKG